MRCLPSLSVVLAVTVLGSITPSLKAQSATTRVDSTQAARAGYTLRPGDIIRLRIWREPDLSGDFPVDEFGRVNLPLIGMYTVTNETREVLHQRLLSAFKKSVENLSMDVVFIRRVPVVGAVRTPGLYPIDPTMTVGDAIALAGGATGDGEDAKIRLMRSGRSIIADVDAALLVSELPIERGDQLYIPPNEGFFDRNPWIIGTAIQSLVTLTAAIVTVSRR
jgi:protein involved in polysaccharide export with SLBB domain